MNIKQIHLPPINIKKHEKEFFLFETHPNLLGSFVFDGSNQIFSSIEGENLIDDECEVIEYANNNNLTLQLVSGDVFCNEVNVNEFKGGFYQGAFKLHDYPYDMFPTRFLNGVSFEFFITLSGESCDNSLNSYFEDNEGFILYYGLKKENPFMGVSGDIFSCSDVKYIDNIVDQTQYPWEVNNSFLVYNETNRCANENINYDYIVKYDTEDIINNAFGIRITRDGVVNVRYIAISGECDTYGYGVVNHFSEEIIPLNEICQVVFNFVPLKKYDDCDINLPIQNMKFEVWVNGYLKYSIIIPEIMTHELNMQKEFQVGLPYNLSIGGGTVGNLENIIEKKINSYFCEYDICVSSNIENLTQIEISGQTINVDVPIDNLETYIINNFDPNFKFNTISSGGCAYFKGTIITETKLIKFIFNEIEHEFIEKNCKRITYEDSLDLIALNFAGSFIGNIYCVNIYDKYLTTNQVRHGLNNNCLDIDLNKKCCI